MKKPYLLLTLLLAFVTTFSFADSALDEDGLLDPQTVSKALGHSFAKNLMETPGFQFDIQSVVEGIEDALSGKPSPLSDVQYEKAFDIIQQRYLEEVSTANLNQANSFLQKNLEESNIVELVPGKLQISILNEGKGDDVVQENDIPLVHYSGKYLDETSIGNSEEPIHIQMEQAFPGIKKGLIGAKKGEQRRLFIHPEMSHSSSDIAFPNTLMILDITVVETNSSIEQAQSE
jgi:FKBP-type peptidyl-prolyl cis-trans isomerase